jgi:DNA-binding NarL/FixJ family response regulator
MRDLVIYIVDSHTHHGNLLMYRLKSRKFPVVKVFPTPEECLYTIRKGQLPDFLISETTHNTIGSIEFCRLVKNLSPNTRIIFFSSSEDENQAFQLLANGATDFISKTGDLEFSTAELVKNLEYLYKTELS